MTVAEFVLEPLNVAGAQLRFFAPVKPDGVEVTAAVLTWQEMRNRSLELTEGAHGQSQVRLTEDQWYEKAQGIFNSHKTELQKVGVSEEAVAQMLEDYFSSHPHPEIESWLGIVAGRSCDGTQTASYH